MKELMHCAANFILVPRNPPDGDPLGASLEVIFVTSEPQYSADAAGHIVRARTTETVRFSTSPEVLRLIGADLIKWADEAQAFCDRHQLPEKSAKPGKSTKKAAQPSLPDTAEAPG